MTSFASIHTEGGLVSADTLARIAGFDPGIPGLGPEDYHLAPGENLREATSRAWSRLVACWRAFRAALEKAPLGAPATTLTRERFLLPLFQELGYGRLTAARTRQVPDGDGTRDYAISHEWGPAPIHLLGANVSLDERTEKVAGAARMSPHSLVQDFLNRSDAHLWAFVSNGRELRVLRDHRSLTRQAYLSVDLESLFDGERFADFALLYLVCHQSRVEGDPPESCWLEKWFQLSREAGVRALDDLRTGVETALTGLGQGFLRHPANGELRRALREGTFDRTEYYRELLRLVYRLIFVFAAEDRLVEGRPALLDPAAPADAVDRYLRFYSTRRLRQLAGETRGSPHGDLWLQLRLVFASLHQGCPPLALPALGSFLFGPIATRRLATCELANSDLLTAIRALAYLQRDGVRQAIAWRAVAADELGSIYESLLELHPVLDAGESFKLETAAGHERKKTGTYYTPTSLVDCLLDSALEPVLDEAVKGKDQAGQERALLGLTVCDPACGSGHFLVAAARRIARRLAALRTGDEEPSPRHMRTALRDVVGRCLYGVDISEMAVELCKVALWMEALEPGKPLSFLDAHIQQGNSLLGTTPALLARGIPDEAWAALPGDNKAIVKALKKRNRDARKGQLSLAPQLADAAAALSDAARQAGCLKADTLDEIRACETRWHELVSSPDYREACFLADLWCAAFVWPATEDLAELAPTQDVFERAAQDLASVPRKTQREVSRLAGQHSFFHWHLAFPHIFTPDLQPAADDPCGWSGGFDVVLGNPPWGQKQTLAETLPWHLVDLKHPSASGIREYCRPFIDLDTHLLRSGGAGCMVLPDIVLLKDYEPTRRRLLAQQIERIEWWGMVFQDATIDACSISWRSAVPAPTHEVHVAVHDPDRPLDHAIPQQTFASLERACFNLFLTPEKLQFLERFAPMPRLEELFEVHEGVHSGNIRRELFVDSPLDESCRPLVFGGDELRPYSIEWHGRYIRLSAAPARRTKARYANIGRPEWFQQPKVVVRRTGDSVQAAVDESGAFVSNNFFVIVPTRPAGLTMDGLCALLSSSWATNYFRTVEPREGRAFAEIKIKHLNRIPVPPGALVPDPPPTIGRLNTLGLQRRRMGRDPGEAGATVEEEIEATVLQAFSDTTPLAALPTERKPTRRTDVAPSASTRKVQ